MAYIERNPVRAGLCRDPDTLQVFERRLGKKLRPRPSEHPRKQSLEEETTQIGFAFGR
jgi:hypothetical protein